MELILYLGPIVALILLSISFYNNVISYKKKHQEVATVVTKNNELNAGLLFEKASSLLEKIELQIEENKTFATKVANIEDILKELSKVNADINTQIGLIQKEQITISKTIQLNEKSNSMEHEIDKLLKQIKETKEPAIKLFDQRVSKPWIAHNLAGYKPVGAKKRIQKRKEE